MRVVKCDFFVGDRYSGDWRSIHYANETISFDLNSETDRRLTTKIFERNHINRRSGTAIRGGGLPKVGSMLLEMRNHSCDFSVWRIHLWRRLSLMRREDATAA